MNQRTRNMLASRRQERDLLTRGYEVIGEFGGNLWQLYRGARYDHRIVDAVVSTDGKSIFVKIEKQAA